MSLYRSSVRKASQLRLAILHEERTSPAPDHSDAALKVKEFKKNGFSCKTCIKFFKASAFAVERCRLKDKVVRHYNICEHHVPNGKS
jgi:hypothetical protein